MKDAPYIVQYLKETEEIARTVDQGRIAKIK